MITTKEIIYRLKRPYHFFKTGLFGGFPAQLRYFFPEKKLKIIAVTGTDGKTTTSSLIYQLLKEAGYKVGLISTVAAYIGDQELDTGFHVTSPHPHDLYKFLRQMVAAKIEYLVLEVTSQGAYQYRMWGIKPFIAGLTNVDFEHLDYHLTQENYLAAKMLVLNHSRTAVVNQDQDIFAHVKKNLRPKTKLMTFGKETRFSSALEKAIRTTVREDYNRLNAYLAITIVKKIGITDKDIIAALAKFKLPQGRMEIVPNNLNFTMIVDFAHTPQGLNSALSNIRKNYVKKNAQLIGLVGCAGLRDVQKRPKMGKIMGKYCDIAIFTAEDPRTENIWSIINQMKSGLEGTQAKVISLPHREEALTWAIKEYGKKNNVIAIFGKGHEQSMCYDGVTETLWNDICGAQKIIKKLEKETTHA